MLMRSSAAWHVQLQRARSRQFLFALREPDDVSVLGSEYSHLASPDTFKRKKSGYDPNKTGADVSPFRSLQARVKQDLADEENRIEASEDEHDERRSRKSEDEHDADEVRSRVSDDDADENRSRASDDDDWQAWQKDEAEGWTGAYKSEATRGEVQAAIKLQSHHRGNHARKGVERESDGPHRSVGQMELSAEMGEERNTAILPQEFVGTFSCHGIDRNEKKINQDCACIAHPLDADPGAALFLVLDGHGRKGHEVSAELLRNLYNKFTRFSWDNDDTANLLQLTSAFLESHEVMRSFKLDAEGVPAALSSGACALAIVIRSGKLWAAHAGDCRAVLGKLDADGSLVAEALTVDHHPDDPEEAARIEATGAYIRPERDDPDGYTPSRIYYSATEPRRGPGLTMSRVLGDLDASDAGIIPMPTVSTRRIAQSDRFVVLASDGLWEFLPTEDVVEVVGNLMKMGKTATQAARFLIAKAALAWKTEEGDYRDDISAIVIYLEGLASVLPS